MSPPRGATERRTQTTRGKDATTGPPFMTDRRRRHLFFALAAAALVVAAPATARPSSVGLTMPRRLAQGDLVNITAVARPARPTACTLAIRYADGQMQPNIPAAGGSKGRVKWHFRIMGNAAPGRATVTASCRGARSEEHTSELQSR